MSEETLTELKGRFDTGDPMNQTAFHNLIESAIHPNETRSGISHGTDTDHDLDISAGSDFDATNLIAIRNTATVTIAIDGGTGANALDTGTATADTAYAIWKIRKSTDGTVAGLFSLSATSPTMPTGYDQKVLIGMMITDVSVNIRTAKWYKDGVMALAADIDEIDTTTPALSFTDITLKVPTGVEWGVLVKRTLEHSGTGNYCDVRSDDAVLTDRLITQAAAVEIQSHFWCRSDAAQTIEYLGNTASGWTTFKVSVNAFKLLR